MKTFITPTSKGKGFTKGKEYEVLGWLSGTRVTIRDDFGATVDVPICRPTSTLVGGVFQISTFGSGMLAEITKKSLGKVRESVEVGAVKRALYVEDKSKYNHNGELVDIKQAMETLDELAKVLRCERSELVLQAKVVRQMADALSNLVK